MDEIVKSLQKNKKIYSENQSPLYQTQSLLEQGKIEQTIQYLSEKVEYLQSNNQMLEEIIQLIINYNHPKIALEFIENMIDISKTQTNNFLEMYFLQLLLPLKGNKVTKSKLYLVSDENIKQNINQALERLQNISKLAVQQPEQVQIEIQNPKQSKLSKILSSKPHIKRILVLFIIIISFLVLTKKYNLIPQFYQKFKYLVRLMLGFE